MGCRTWGICDRCGFRFLLNTLKNQVVAKKRTNLLVCSACLDEDHPQWFPAPNTGPDPKPILNIRPERPDTEIGFLFFLSPVDGEPMLSPIDYDQLLGPV